jgi:predicted RNA-binding protein
MKRIGFLTAFFAFFLCSLGAAQITEGKITYSLDFPDLDIPAAQKSFLPSESVTYFKEGKSRSETNAGMGVKSVTISTSKEVVMLIDMMGDKKAIRQDISKIDKSNNVNITEEEKRIAGYVCRKAILSSGGDDKVEVWFTKDIVGGGTWGGSFDKIKGAPMEYVIENSGMKMKMTALSVSAEKVDAKIFEIPKGYKEITEEELRKDGLGK